MGDLIEKNVSQSTLQGVTIHFSRFNEASRSKGINILYVHDMFDDPMYENVNFDSFDAIVFVSGDQMARFAGRYSLPYEDCYVIPNATTDIVGRTRQFDKYDPIRFIYHTTPHRGLEGLVNKFDIVKRYFPAATLDVYSSFKVYGWDQADESFKDIFDKINQRSDMTYHGYQSREIVYEALQNADVFYYPNTHPETSCIALIEALRAGVVCIIPDRYALKETARGYYNAIIYNESAYIDDLMRDIQTILKGKIQHGFHRNGTYLPCNPYHTEETFKSQWETLIARLKWKRITT